MDIIVQAREKLKSVPLEKKILLAPQSAPELLNLLLEEDRPEINAAALDNPHINVQHVHRMIKNPASTAEILEKIAKNKEWMRSVTVQVDIIKNPHTPISVALEFVHSLNINDIVYLLGAGGMQSGLRQRLFEIFRQRVLQVGETQRINLLGRVPAEAAQVIIDMGGDKVLSEAIKRNYIRQYNALKIAHSYQTSPKVLTELYESPFGQQYEVRWALVNNDSTPKDIRLRIVKTLSQADQLRLRQQKKMLGAY